MIHPRITGATFFKLRYVNKLKKLMSMKSTLHQVYCDKKKEAAHCAHVQYQIEQAPPPPPTVFFFNGSRPSVCSRLHTFSANLVAIKFYVFEQLTSMNKLWENWFHRRSTPTGIFVLFIVAAKLVEAKWQDSHVLVKKETERLDRPGKHDHSSERENFNRNNDSADRATVIELHMRKGNSACFEKVNLY